MANVNAQSVEDFADRIIYRFTAARFEQVPVTFYNAITPGLKTLVNTQASTSFVVPASGISAKFFKIEWVFNLGIVLENDQGALSLFVADIDFLKYSTPSPALNYDGKSLQTEFYEKKTENYYSSPQLRAINVSNIAVEPKTITSNFVGGAAADKYRLEINNASSVTYLVALLQPIVTFYKK